MKVEVALLLLLLLLVEVVLSTGTFLVTLLSSKHCNINVGKRRVYWYRLVRNSNTNSNETSTNPYK